MPLADKREIVSEIKDHFHGASAVIMTDYRGLTVKQMQALRSKLRESGAEVKVYKNTLTELALRELALPSMDSMLAGPTAFVFATGDPVGPAKAIMDFAKTNKSLEVKGGFVDHVVVGADDIKAIAALPSRDVLIARSWVRAQPGSRIHVHVQRASRSVGSCDEGGRRPEGGCMTTVGVQ